MPERPRVLVGVMAHQEEGNIGHLLESLFDQDQALEGIVVVASGCTDGTVQRVQEAREQDRRIELIEEPVRKGKASAVNLLLAAARRRLDPEDILVMVGADCEVRPGSLARLVDAFVDPEVGMAGGRPLPVNQATEFWGFVAHLLWGLHHEIALEVPKCGEMVAVRSGLLYRIPPDTVVDELAIEPLVRGQGYRLSYCPEAVVANRGPGGTADFLEQRSRIFLGHLRERDRCGYSPSTMGAWRVLQAVPRAARPLPFRPHWLLAACLLEAAARTRAWVRWLSGEQPAAAWTPIPSTKQLRCEEAR